MERGFRHDEPYPADHRSFVYREPRLGHHLAVPVRIRGQRQELGPHRGVLAGTAFCIGAVIAAPLAGRLADRYPAGPLATLFTLAAGASSVGLGLATSPVQFLAAIALFGGALTAVGPATQVMVLEYVQPADRRAVFAYQFTALALGMAAGAFAAGLVVDLDRPTGMWPGFLGAAGGFAVSGLLLHLASDHAPVLTGAEHVHVETAAPRPSGWETYRHFVDNRQLRLLALVSMALAAGFYAQFETGLPAFALQALNVSPSTVGTAAAANCLVIVALQWLVVETDRKARRRSSPGGRCGYLGDELAAARGSAVRRLVDGRPALRHRVHDLRTRRDDVRADPQPTGRLCRTGRVARHDLGDAVGAADRSERGWPTRGRCLVGPRRAARIRLCSTWRINLLGGGLALAVAAGSEHHSATEVDSGRADPSRSAHV